MAYQKDYALSHCGEWKDGQMPVITTKIVVVSHDNSNHAYAVDVVDLESGAFIEWVAANWESDRDPRGIWDEEAEDLAHEAAEDYLDRIGVRVWEA